MRLFCAFPRPPYILVSRFSIIMFHKSLDFVQLFYFYLPITSCWQFTHKFSKRQFRYLFGFIEIFDILLHLCKLYFQGGGGSLRIILLENSTETEIWRNLGTNQSWGGDGHWHQGVVYLGHIRDRFRVR